jgi:hypothetical protein
MNAAPAISPILTSPFLSSPFPWVILAGLMVGAAVSRLTMRTSRRSDPARARTRTWVFVCVYLSLAVIFGLLALFLPGHADAFRDIRLAWAAGAAAVLAFAVMRFKRALGIPVVVLLIAVILLLGLFVQSIRSFTGETRIATVTVISAENNTMKLELAPVGSEPVMLDLGGAYFAPVAKVVIFEDWFVFLGAKTWYRFEGMNGFDTDLNQVGKGYRLPRPPGMTEKLWAFFEDNEKRIPVVKTVQVAMDMKKAREFSRYAVMIQNDGGLEIVADSH